MSNETFKKITTLITELENEDFKINCIMEGMNTMVEILGYLEIAKTEILESHKNI